MFSHNVTQVTQSAFINRLFDVKHKYVRREKLMACDFELGLYTSDADFAFEMIELGIEEIRRIERLLSEFDPESETSIINNRSTDEYQKIDEECFDLIHRSIQISALTNGAFDISVGSLKKLYTFKGNIIDFPDDNLIKKALKEVGYQKIILDKVGKRMRFSHKALKIGFAAIGKGYAADKVKQLWKGRGVESGYINASGDLTVFGLKENGKKWNVVIPNPGNKSEALLNIPLKDAAIATSGDYEQYFIHNNRRYSHNIDPISGLPLIGLKSVSVISPSAELSDALATACYVMGKEKSLKFVEQLPLTHCIIIDEENRLYLSQNVEYN